VEGLEGVSFMKRYKLTPEFFECQRKYNEILHRYATQPFELVTEGTIMKLRWLNDSGDFFEAKERK
jgi:hypothetical protein